MVVSLPGDLVPVVLRKGRRFNFQLGMVYLRFRSKIGQYSDVPPEHMLTQPIAQMDTSSGKILERKRPSPTPDPGEADEYWEASDGTTSVWRPIATSG